MDTVYSKMIKKNMIYDIEFDRQHQRSSMKFICYWVCSQESHSRWLLPWEASTSMFREVRKEVDTSKAVGFQMKHLVFTYATWSRVQRLHIQSSLEVHGF